jgi:hypothetical protein
MFFLLGLTVAGGFAVGALGATPKIVTGDAHSLLLRADGTLWAWDAPQSRWLFDAPSLDAQGGGALTDIIASKNYADFGASAMTLGQGLGFCVNRP